MYPCNVSNEIKFSIFEDNVIIDNDFIWHPSQLDYYDHAKYEISLGSTVGAIEVGSWE
jgi:hypothetical protein